MQSEVYSATSLGAYTRINSTAKSALSGPQNKETLAQVRSDLISLVAQGKIKFRDNAHLLLNMPNPQTVFDPTGKAQPTVHFTLDTLLLDAIKIS